MVKIKVRLSILIAFLLIFFGIISVYSVIVWRGNPTTTSTTTSMTTTTISPHLKEHLIDLANENIQDKCNVTYTHVERKHVPTSKWFTNLCPDFKNHNETEKWRTSAYLNDECDLEKENGCIEILTSISLDEKLICVWAIKHPVGELIPLENLTQKYC